jgi:hypothetical protein
LDLGRLLAQGQDAILAAEIDREVQGLDRKNADEKCKYFGDKLGINWFDGKANPLLERAPELRNRILHENPEQDVSETDLTLLSIVSVGIVFASIVGAAVLYPTVCALPEKLKADEAKTLFVKR